jgi:hypothetical protein
VPEFSPSWSLTWELVRLGNRDQIVAVFVAGRLRLWRGWPIDWEAGLLAHTADQNLFQVRPAQLTVGSSPAQLHQHKSIC